MNQATTTPIRVVRRINIGGRSVIANSSSDESSTSSASMSSGEEEEEEEEERSPPRRDPISIMSLLERRRSPPTVEATVAASSSSRRRKPVKRKRVQPPPPPAATSSHGQHRGSSCTESEDDADEEEERRQRARTQNREAQRSLLQGEQFARARDATEAAAEAAAEQNTHMEVAHAPIRDELEPLWPYENDQEEEKDERSRRWQPAVSPFQRELDALLYEDEDRDGPCWACKFGEDETNTVNGEHWDKMIKLFVSMLPSVDLPVIAQEIHKYFYTQVLAPLHNRRKALGSGGKLHEDSADGAEDLHLRSMQYLKKVWSPYKVIEHFRKILTPSIRLAIRLREVRSLIHLQLRNNTVEMHNTSGRQRLNQDGVKLLTDLIKLETTLYNQKPDKQAFHNPRRSSSSDGYAMATPKRAMLGSHQPLPLFGS